MSDTLPPPQWSAASFLHASRITLSGGPSFAVTDPSFLHDEIVRRDKTHSVLAPAQLINLVLVVMVSVETGSCGGRVFGWHAVKSRVPIGNQQLSRDA